MTERESIYDRGAASWASMYIGGGKLCYWVTPFFVSPWAPPRREALPFPLKG
jgi:hypothetical protein